MRWLIALACIDAGVLGHRADIVVSRTAQTLCALREAEAVVERGTSAEAGAPPTESLYVTVADITAAADLALRHRRRERPGERGGTPSVAAERQRERMQELAEQAREETAAADGEPQEPDRSTSDDGPGRSRGQRGRPARCGGPRPGDDASRRRSALRGRAVPGAVDQAAPRPQVARRHRQALQLRVAGQAWALRPGGADRAHHRRGLRRDPARGRSPPAAAARRGLGRRASSPPGAPGSPPEGPPAADRDPHRLRRRRQRLDGRRAAHAGDQGSGALAAARRLRPPRQGGPGRLLGPHRAGRALPDQ